MPGEVELLVQVCPPFGAIGHIVDNALVSDKFSGAAFACITAQLHFRDDIGGEIHGTKLYRVLRGKEKSPDLIRRFSLLQWIVLTPIEFRGCVSAIIVLLAFPVDWFSIALTRDSNSVASTHILLCKELHVHVPLIPLKRFDEARLSKFSIAGEQDQCRTNI